MGLLYTYKLFPLCTKIFGGHKNFLQIRECRLKKRGFIAKYARVSTNSGVKTKKKKVFIVKSAKNSSCSEILGDDQNFGGLSTPMAPSLLLSLGHNPRLGGTNLVWWQKQSFGVDGPGMPPVAPDLIAQQP